jgi:DedD protein
MKWAFWRRRKPRANGAGSGAGRGDAKAAGRSGDPGADPTGSRAAEAAQLRRRTRQRLIGAAVLLLGTAVVVPMLLDPAPRPLPDNIPIDIPSERTPFVPRLSLPQDSGAAASAAAPAVRGASEASDEPPAPALQDSGSAAPADRSADKAASDKPSARTAEPAGRSDAGHWIVQAAALSSQGAAHQLSERLSKAGLAPFVERTETSEGALYRVRVGPYPSKESAAKARKHLHGLGVDSTVVRVDEAGR